MMMINKYDAYASGTPGTSGTSGTPGTSGTSGTPGTSGTSDTSYGSINATLTQPLMDAGDKIKNRHTTTEQSFKAAIFGFSDGLTTSINLVLGVALTHQSHATVVLTGMAGLFAGASSMACGEWISARAERDQHERELATERTHLQTIPEEEAQHMKTILMSFGLTENTVDTINREVANLPLDRQVAFHGRFELGIEVEDHDAPVRSAATMWVTFVVGAFVPVLPWMLTSRFETAITGSIGGSVCGMCGIALYQVRGNYRALPWMMLRQILITTAAVGLTVLFDMWFTAHA